MNVIDTIKERLRVATTYGMFILDEESTQIDREIDARIDTIKNCRDLESAREKMKELELLSEMLSNSHYRYRIPISKKQRDVVDLFDWGYPGQDPDAFAFKAIQSGRFGEEAL
jgi:hypothetical protein